MSRDMDIRRLDVDSFELREVDGEMTINGHAAVFDRLSEPIMGMFRERIVPGAFARSLQDAARDVFALWQHDTSMPLARRSKGTLRISEDAKGLAVEIDLPDTSYGRDVAANVRSGLVDKMSFGFSVPPGGDTMTKERDENGLPIRELRDVDLFEVSPVTLPAYPDTSLSARSREAAEAIAADAGAGRLDILKKRLDLAEQLAR